MQLADFILQIIRFLTLFLFFFIPPLFVSKAKENKKKRATDFRPTWALFWRGKGSGSDKTGLLCTWLGDLVVALRPTQSGPKLASSQVPLHCICSTVLPTGQVPCSPRTHSTHPRTDAAAPGQPSPPISATRGLQRGPILLLNHRFAPKSASSLQRTTTSLNCIHPVLSSFARRVSNPLRPLVTGVLIIFFSLISLSFFTLSYTSLVRILDHKCATPWLYFECAPPKVNQSNQISQTPPPLPIEALSTNRPGPLPTVNKIVVTA